MTRSGVALLSENPFRLDVGDLSRRPGASKRLDAEVQVSDFQVGLGRVGGDGVLQLALLAESLVEGILVTGEVSGIFALECSRCVAEFERPFSVAVEEMYAYPGQPGIEEGFVVDDDTLDLLPALRDAVLTAVPANPVHDAECKGLCATCGQDLNVGDCGHAHEPVDVRWEPLRRLRDQIGE